MRKTIKPAVEILALLCAFSLSGYQNNNASDSNDLPVTGTAPPPELRKLDGGVKKLLERWNLPGASIAVCRGGKILFARGYGFADIDNETPIVPEKSLFRIASISKSITAAAVLKLVEENKLKLDDKALPLVLPAPGASARTDRRLPNISVRDLLQMSAGWDKERSGDPILQPYIFKAARRMHKPGPADFDTTMQFVLGRRLDFTPGTRFSYSNFEYGLLGKLVEKTSGEDYETYVRQTFFEPAGVQLYKGHTREEDRLPNEVCYYAPLEPSERALLPGIRKNVAAPYSRAYIETDLPILGWVATAPELALLVDRLTTDDTFLRPETRQLMTERPSISCWKNRHKYFALGWEVTKDAHGRVSLYKDGTLPGTRAFVEHTANDMTWVALFNGRPPQKMPDKFAHQVREMMTSGLDYVQISLPAPPVVPARQLMPDTPLPSTIAYRRCGGRVPIAWYS